jgi:hypothetical protein
MAEAREGVVVEGWLSGRRRKERWEKLAADSYEQPRPDISALKTRRLSDERNGQIYPNDINCSAR